MHINIWLGNPKERTLLGGLIRQKDYIKTDFKETGYGSVNWTELVQDDRVQC